MAPQIVRIGVATFAAIAIIGGALQRETLQEGRIGGVEGVVPPVSVFSQKTAPIVPRVLHSEVCTQKKICEYFKDILVVLHLNPQRFDWLEHILQYAQNFAPNIILTTIPDSTLTRNMTFAEQRAYLDHLTLHNPPHYRYIHLIENKFGLTGDHHDIVKAMELYPNYTGYMYWAHEDALPGFWNMISLDKESVWHQPIEKLFAFSHTLPVCPLKLKRKHHFKSGTRIKQGSRHCVVPMQPHEARDWIGLGHALDRIKNDSAADFAKIIPGVTFASPLYYVPGTPDIRERFKRYSAYLYDAKGVNEFSDHVLLRAASGPKGSNHLKAVNIWPDQGRFHPVAEFLWESHITHPIRPVGELFLRLHDLAQEVQIADMLASLKGKEKALWEVCYTCDEYPVTGKFVQGRKGRFHSCAKGCAVGSVAVNMTTSNGKVVVRKESIPTNELHYEGFWSMESTQLFFSRYAKLNATF